MTGNVIADAVNGAPSYTGKALRTLLGAFLPKPSNRPLGGYSGVTAGTPASIVTATSTVWTVQPHAGVLDVSAATDGPTPYSFDAAVTGGVTAPDSTNPRIDLICVTHNDQSENDGSSGSPAPVVNYVAGVAAASPATPATPARSFVLARLNVPRANNGAPAVVFAAPTVVAAGGVLPVSGPSAYPANPHLSQYLDDATLGLQRWDGTQWQSYGPGGDTGWQPCTMTTAWNQAPLMARKLNGVIFLRNAVGKNSGNAIDATQFVQIATLPAGMIADPGASVRVFIPAYASANGAYGAFLQIPAGGNTVSIQAVGSSTLTVVYPTGVSFVAG